MLGSKESRTVVISMFPTSSAVLVRVRLFLLVGCKLSLKSAERISEESLMSGWGPSEHDGRGV